MLKNNLTEYLDAMHDVHELNGEGEQNNVKGAR